MHVSSFALRATIRTFLRAIPGSKIQGLQVFIAAMALFCANVRPVFADGPQPPFFSTNFRVFYVIAESAGDTAINPTIQASLPLTVTDIIKRARNGAKVKFLAAPEWGSAQLAAACTDPMVSGGVIISYASWQTNNFWVFYNAHKIRVNAHITVVSCTSDEATHNRVGTIVYAEPLTSDPSRQLRPYASHPWITYPIGPIAGVAGLFGAKNQVDPSKGPTTLWTTSNGWYILALSLTKTTGEVGNQNPMPAIDGISGDIGSTITEEFTRMCNTTTLEEQSTGAEKRAELRSQRPGALAVKPKPTDTNFLQNTNGAYVPRQQPLHDLCTDLGFPVQ